MSVFSGFAKWKNNTDHVNLVLDELKNHIPTREAEIRAFFDQLTDSELAEFEKYFIDEFPTLLSKEQAETPRLEFFNARDFSPKQYDQAIENLKRYGPQEGLRRISKGNPRLAQYIQHLLDGTSPQEK